MGDIDYGGLRCLVVDDFSNFRATLASMLTKMGLVHVDQASNVNGLVAACEKRQYDLILSDYDLGPGRNGQRGLEELRYRKLINKRSLFVLVSGNASKEAVLATYDNDPDDYLAKPFTAKVLHQRLDRLLAQRQALMPVYKALDNGDMTRAVFLLTEMSLANNRHSIAAQKTLGRVFIEQGELDKAERVFSLALQARPLDWARLGLARVKALRGDKLVASEWMEQIISDSPLFLPAYDALADNCANTGHRQVEQATMQKAVDISPMSILRHKRLAEVAEVNGDWLTALRAWRRAIKLGEESVHAQAKDRIKFARAAAGALQNGAAIEPAVAQDAAQMLGTIKDHFALPMAEQLQADLLQGRLLALEGRAELAQLRIDEVERVIELENIHDVDMDIERAYIKLALGKAEEAQALIDSLLQTYAYDQESLEKLDRLLSEPVSESNRSLVAQINHAGIELYNQAQYDQALEAFGQARNLFPNHLGIQLNVLQCLAGKLRLEPLSDEQTEVLRSLLSVLNKVVTAEHAQFARFSRLQQMALKG
jgi:CheY-like chemotaxis protein